MVRISSVIIITFLLLASHPIIANDQKGQSLSNQIDDFVRAEMQNDSIPGLALAVLQKGKVIKMSAYGLANLESGVPVSAGSVFELASLTKQFTAMAILLLAEEGKLQLDDLLKQHLPNLPGAWQSITIKQLLSHSAGLTHRFESTTNDVFLTDYTTAQMLDSAKQTPMNSVPGSDWEYSDQGYFLLGLVIEKTSSLSYETFLQQRFFAPLKMNQTTILDQQKIIKNRVAGYKVVNGQVVNIRRDWQFGLTSHFGVMSSLNDMIKWEQALVDQQLISDEVYRQSIQPIYIFQQDNATDSMVAYGFGWWVHQNQGHRYVEHSGFTGTAYLRELDSQISVIVLTNRDQPSGKGTISIAHAVAKLVDDSLSF